MLSAWAACHWFIQSWLVPQLRLLWSLKICWKFKLHKLISCETFELNFKSKFHNNQRMKFCPRLSRKLIRRNLKQKSSLPSALLRTFLFSSIRMMSSKKKQKRERIFNLHKFTHFTFGSFLYFYAETKKKTFSSTNVAQSAFISLENLLKHVNVAHHH